MGRTLLSCFRVSNGFFLLIVAALILAIESQYRLCQILVSTQTGIELRSTFPHRKNGRGKMVFYFW